MKVDLAAILSRKAQKTLECNWSKLLDVKKYKIPTTIEELNFEFNVLKINGITHYFSHITKRDIRVFSSTIFDNPLINGLFCYDTIYKAVISEISSNITNKKTKHIHDTLQSLSLELSNKLEEFRFYFPLLGFCLKDLNEVLIGKISIVHFDENISQKILESRVRTHKDSVWTERVETTINEHFVDKSVMVIPFYGDKVKAEEYARGSAKLIINYFRLFICLFAHERIDENSIRISLDIEWTNKNSQFFFETSNNLYLGDDLGSRPLQIFEFTHEKLNELKEKAFFDDLSDFILNEEKNDFEKCILTSIYWIGEAQNDKDRESSFLKYWIALENIFSSERKKEPNKITHNLCQGISILIFYSGYEFEGLTKIDKLYKEMSDLYNVRSDIVHSGVQKRVSHKELRDLCRFSSWIVLCLFWLRDYFDIESVRQLKFIISNLEKYRDSPADIEIKIERLNAIFSKMSQSPFKLNNSSQ